MNIIKRDKNESYSVICNHALRNINLSLKAKGLFAYIMTLPETWQIYQSELNKHAKDGVDSHRSAMAELEKFGYIVKKRIRGKDGKLKGVEYIVREVAEVGKSNEKPRIDDETVGKTYIGKTKVGKTYLGKAKAIKYLPITNTESINKKNIYKKDLDPFVYMEDFYLSGITHEKTNELSSLINQWIKIKVNHKNASLDSTEQIKILSKQAMQREINLINKSDYENVIQAITLSIQKKYQGLFFSKKTAPKKTNKKASAGQSRLHDKIKTGLESINKKRVKDDLPIFVHFYHEELLGTEQEKRNRVKHALTVVQKHHSTDFFPVIKSIADFITKFDKIEAAEIRNRNQDDRNRPASAPLPADDPAWGLLQQEVDTSAKKHIPGEFVDLMDPANWGTKPTA